MQIKPAVTEKTSDVLKNVSRSNLLQYGFMVVCAVGYPIYMNLPQNVQAKVGQNLLWAGVGVGFATQLLNGKIREARLQIGDTAASVASYALLGTENAQRLEAVKGFIETGAIPSANSIKQNLEALTRPQEPMNHDS
jgi:hypothetical protein